MKGDPNWSPTFVCPCCHRDLVATGGGGTLRCPACETVIEARNGIYRFLRPERLAEVQPLLDQYRRVRADEGYRTRNPAQHRLLPVVGAGDPDRARWRIRRQSFLSLCRRVLPAQGRSRLRILDLGAGNGWLSNRLKALGHDCVAVDLLVDEEDGLGAVLHYGSAFICVQADFDELPLAPAQFNVVVFNASLHYSPGVASTLRRACDRLIDGGVLVVMDSPMFTRDESGRRMIAAQQAQFRATYGTAHEWGAGYLTEAGLEAAAASAGVKLHSVRSRGTPVWALRRVIAGLKEHREPAKFGVWYGLLRKG